MNEPLTKKKRHYDDTELGYEPEDREAFSYYYQEDVLCALEGLKEDFIKNTSSKNVYEPQWSITAIISYIDEWFPIINTHSSHDVPADDDSSIELKHAPGRCNPDCKAFNLPCKGDCGWDVSSRSAESNVKEEWVDPEIDEHIIIKIIDLMCVTDDDNEIWGMDTNLGNKLHMIEAIKDLLSQPSQPMGCLPHTKGQEKVGNSVGDAGELLNNPISPNKEYIGREVVDVKDAPRKGKKVKR